MRDTKSLLLVLLSVVLIGTWFYHLYDKASYSRQTALLPANDPAREASLIKDSLQKIYADSLSKLDTQLGHSTTNADSLKYELETKLAEIEKLKKEISGIINNKSASREDLKIARQKRDELQVMVDQLNDQNLSIEQEKGQLANTLQQLSQEVDGLQKNVKRLTEENQSLTEKVNLASVFVSSELRLAAIDVKSGKETETSKAKNADKLVASFTVQNNLSPFPNAEAVIVLLQPDGQVLRSNVWDSGSFDTKANGKKNFTRKIKFDYEKGEQKKLLFTLDVSDCQKGNYIFQVWHNGVMIGQVSKTLS